MPKNFLQNGLSLLLRQQTNILSAAIIIMGTVVLSFVLGIIRERTLVASFGASSTLGIYLFSTLFPETLFQLTMGAALSSAFIPVFSEYLVKGKEQEGYKMSSTFLMLGLFVFALIGILLFFSAPYILNLFNLGSEFSEGQMRLMTSLMRISLLGQLIFIVASFFSALLQSHSRFFIPGVASSLYNLGIIISVLFFSASLGIYSAPLGIVLGSLLFLIAEIPFLSKINFSFQPAFDYIRSEGVIKIIKLTWPRSISVAIFQLGTLAIASFISYLSDPGRMNVVYSYAKTLAFAPVVLFGQSIAQAAFPVLSRQKDNLENFKITFITSFNQMLYLVLPIATLLLVLRIPVVRLVWGAEKLDWEATVLIGRTLAFFSISIFAQALIILVLRGFYALHNTLTPLLIGAFTTVLMTIFIYIFIVVNHMGVESVAFAYSLASIVQLLLFLVVLDRKVGGFNKIALFISLTKFFFAAFFMGIAIYVPIKLLDQLVFDTTRTINLLLLTGISSFCGFSLYLFLTWLFNVKEAQTFILLFKKIGDWRQILGKREEVIDATRLNP